MEILKEQPTEEKPYIVESYPYGFKRTQKRYWIETTKNGQRVASQTLNPKTNQWNKPKRSTYDNIKLLGLDENNHIKSVSCRFYSLKETQEFKAKYEQYFNDYQKKEVDIFDLNKVVEVDDKGNPMDTEAEEKKEKENRINLNKAMVLNASKETGIKSALETFKRA